MQRCVLNCLACLPCLLPQVFWIFLLFKGMSLLGILRVPLDEEAMGLDAAAMGTVDVNAVLPQQTKVRAGTPA